MSDETVVEIRPVEDSVRIAVTAEKINNLQKELSQHTMDDKEFQVKIFSFLQTSIADLNLTVKAISDKLDTVWDDMTIRRAKKSAFTELGSIVNIFATLLISAGTAYIIMKYGNK